MPTKGSEWSPAHRAAFEASIAARRAANPPKRLAPKSERPTAHKRINDLERRVDRLASRVFELERELGNRPYREWKPNHRRVVDGGIHVAKQRKARKQSVRKEGVND